MPASFEPDNHQRSPSRGVGTRSRLPLRLALSGDFSHGRLDGAWWPQSRNLETELTDLVTNFPAVLGRITCATCSRSDWERAPSEVRVGGEIVEVGQLQQDGTHMVILTLRSRNLTLLLVPPETSEVQAGEAMRVASSPTNHASARDVLLAPGASRSAPAEVVPRRSPPPAASNGNGALTTTIDFAEDGGNYKGRSAGGRQWRISEVLTGWRLEFRDAGDTVSTNAGIHRTVQAAIAEANR